VPQNEFFYIFYTYFHFLSTQTEWGASERNKDDDDNESIFESDGGGEWARVSATVYKKN
jgi:hypothetical protein